MIHYRKTPTRYQNADKVIKKTLNSAYQRLLAHQNEDGSFIFCLQDHKKTPSTFLTASAIDVLRRLQQGNLSKGIDNITIMPCPSICPKSFWTVQIILVEYQPFWTCPIHLGQVQTILDWSKSKLNYCS